MNKSSQELESYLEFAKSMAREAGLIMRRYYRSAENVVSHKADKSVVTLADTEINKLLINKIRTVYPEHGVLGEEESYMPERSSLWVCDPIDGTMSYINHVPTSTFALAFVQDGVPLVGLVFNPWTEDLYFAIRGKGAYRNEDRLSVAAAPCNPDGRNVLANSRLTDGIKGWRKPDAVKKYFVLKAQGAVFQSCLVAEGSANGQIYESDGAHDVAAMACITKEAGGKITDLDGRDEQHYGQPVNGFICSDGRIHDELLHLVRASRSL